MQYYLKIFGCQMNYSDAERISTILENYKIKKSASIEEADFIIFVTCGVRQSAENRVYGQIHNIRKHYHKKIIILTGCLAHRKDVQRRSKKRVNLFTTIENFSREIKKILDTRCQILDTKNKQYSDYLKIKPKYNCSHTAYIPVMTGCNNFCSYCVVPYARGREYSRPAENILKEVKNLIKRGCKEIVLLGQNVNSYKSKTQNTGYKILDTKKSVIEFSDLLRLLDNIPGKFWITFLTSHPKDMSDELIETIAKSKNICEYISLPVQSGDNEILRRMNRKYTIAHYKNLIKKIRSAIPDSAISTDIIIGFPCETKKQFKNTAKLLREMNFDMAYINQYSPRPETAAWKMRDNVSKKEKGRREKVLTNILEKTALKNNKKYVGKVVEVLVDKKFLDKQKYSGHTRTQKKVIFRESKKITVGNFVKVKIVKAKAFGLEGETVL